jgi:hypothetical protein
MNSNNGTRRAMPSRTLTSALAATLAVGALAAPGALARPAPPDPTPAYGGAVAARSLDLRTPDAIDAATSSEPVSAAPAGDGFAWGDAAIGAGGAVGAVVIALGATVAVTRRRVRSTTKPAGLIG